MIDTFTRQEKAERSIIKKYRKELWSRFTRAVRDYRLISDNDKIAVCISGGKDSFLLAKLMQELQKHGQADFEVVYLCMDPGYNRENMELIRKNADTLGIPLTVFRSQIFEAVENIPNNPCYLCARMRRGYLYNNAKLLGCNKIALGHHYDDVIETIMMGILYAGKTETMLPRLKSQNFEGMELIRPMYLVREADVKAWRDHNELEFLRCACRMTEKHEQEMKLMKGLADEETDSAVSGSSPAGARLSSKRARVKKLIRMLAEEDPVIEGNIFNCVRDINLRTILGYHKDGESHNFLQDLEGDIKKDPGVARSPSKEREK